MAAVRRIQPDVWHQPAFLERLVADAVGVVIGEGEQEALAIRLSGAR